MIEYIKLDRIGMEINSSELKTKVSETVHDDFLIAGKHLGFSNRSEFLRYLVERELYGVSSKLQITRIPGAVTGQDK